MTIKLDLGGGYKPIPDHVNVDLIAEADLRINLQQVGDSKIQLPLESDSVDAVFSSHCIEHIYPYSGLVHEICRVCRVGAEVEFRVPHWLSPGAGEGDHRHVLSRHAVEHWYTLPEMEWKEKWLHWRRCVYGPSEYFRQVARLYPEWSPLDLLRYAPAACHDVAFIFSVQERPVHIDSFPEDEIGGDVEVIEKRTSPVRRMAETA